eukprot:15268081-Ditylum_brightwellii.AAC.1
MRLVMKKQWSRKAQARKKATPTGCRALFLCLPKRRWQCYHTQCAHNQKVMCTGQQGKGFHQGWRPMPVGPSMFPHWGNTTGRGCPGVQKHPAHPYVASIVCPIPWWSDRHKLKEVRGACHNGIEEPAPVIELLVNPICQRDPSSRLLQGAGQLPAEALPILAIGPTTGVGEVC